MKFLRWTAFGALAVGIPIATTLAATPIDRRIDADPNGILDVHNVAGSVEIEGGNGREVHVTGMLADNVERLDVTRDGDRVVVEVVLEEDERSSESTTLTIEAPRGMRVEVDTVSASIDVTGIEGDQRLASVSGTIESEASGTTRSSPQELVARSVSGTIEIEGRGRPALIRAQSVSGRVSLTNVAGEVHAEAVSGTVDVAAEELGRAELSSISGSVSLTGAMRNDARVEATTTSGNLELVFAGDAAAEYRLSSFSGRIDNCFGPRPPQQRGPGSEHRFEEGNSEARVSARTMSGSIELCRR
jgi:DUF4097 and DUF4098 domain-containing protein YvlB